MNNKDKIFDIIDEFRTQNSSEDEINNYYQISIYCNQCKKDLTRILSYDSVSREVEYICDCGNQEK